MSWTSSEEPDSMWPNSSAAYDRNGIRTFVTEDSQLYNPTASDAGFVMNPADYKMTIKVIECWIVSPLSVLGLPTNVINMVVFYRQGLRDKVNLCLFALASADFMALVCVFVYTLYCAGDLFLHAATVQMLKWSILKFTLNFRNAFLYTSGLLTAIIATERCVCVMLPMKSATIFKTTTMAWTILGVVAGMNILCLPYALKHVVRLVTDDTGNVTAILDDTDLYVNHKLAFQVVRDGILPSISFTTFFVVSFVTVVTVRKLRTAMDWRQKTSTNATDKRQITLVKILITVSCVYIACSVPKLSLAIVKFLVADFSTLGKYSDLFFVTHAVAFAPLMVNSSVNVFIYYRQSSRFRKELRACVCCFREKTENKIHA